MNRIWICMLCVVSAISLAQQTKPASSAQGNEVMIAAVSRDDSVLSGGISGGRLKAPGKVDVEPLAMLTPNGEWKRILCDTNPSEECRKFEQEYLSKPHTYTVVSADGHGAIVQVDKMGFEGECFDYGGEGTFSGASIAYAAVAAESTDFFTTGKPAKRLAEQNAEPIRKALAEAAGGKLDSTRELRVYSVRLEGQDLFVVQRAFQDYASRPDIDPRINGNLKSVFAIGTMQDSNFHPLYTMNIDNGNELILGTIHLKNGRDFLVTSVNDSESQDFRIYGIRDDKLVLVFSGGGSSC